MTEAGHVRGRVVEEAKFGDESAMAELGGEPTVNGWGRGARGPAPSPAPPDGTGCGLRKGAGRPLKNREGADKSAFELGFLKHSFP